MIIKILAAWLVCIFFMWAFFYSAGGGKSIKEIWQNWRARDDSK